MAGVQSTTCAAGRLCGGGYTWMSERFTLGHWRTVSDFSPPMKRSAAAEVMCSFSLRMSRFSVDSLQIQTSK